MDKLKRGVYSFHCISCALKLNCSCDCNKCSNDNLSSYSRVEEFNPMFAKILEITRQSRYHFENQCDWSKKEDLQDVGFRCAHEDCFKSFWINHTLWLLEKKLIEDFQTVAVSGPQELLKKLK